MSRRKFTWTDNQFDKLNKVQGVLTELQEYKPLTLRQVYYQLVGQGFIENNNSQYTMLSQLLKWARIEGHISWDDIEDRVRKLHDLTGWTDSKDFIDTSLYYFLNNYSRNRLQTQEKFIEIWIEKDALSSLFRKIAGRYSVSVVVCRGFSSISFLQEYKERVLHHPEKEPVLLYFGDFDPSGVEMLSAMETTFRDEFHVQNIRFRRVALLKEDILKYQLPHSPEAIKKTDTRTAKHVQQYGELAVELDALRPDVLEAKISEAIESEIDMELYNEEYQNESADIDKLNRIKAMVNNTVSWFM